MSRFFDLVLLAIITIASAGQQSFDGGNYVVEWTHLPATQEIQFTLTVNATGWVGLGISKENDDMKKLDVAVGGFNITGHYYLWDMYANTTSRPTEDAQKDVQFVSGNESNGVTHLSFKRKLDTGDTTKDNAVQVNGSYFLAWAYHSTNDGTDPLTFPYHSKRGYSAAIMLVHTASVSSVPPPSPTEKPTTDTTKPATTVASSYSPTFLLLAVAVVAVNALSLM